MNTNWHDNTPIYRQLKDRVIAMILDDELKPGDALPSVRQVAAELKLNHLTVLRAYQELTDEGLAEKRRGIGLFVTEGAVDRLLEAERMRFVSNELPELVKRINRLGVDVDFLMQAIKDGGKKK